MDDRIDALLSDIEAADMAAQTHARWGELGDEVATHAAERTMLERLRGTLGQRVRLATTAREIEGTAVFLGRGIFVVTGAEVAIVSISHIIGLRVPSRRHRFDLGPLERLGMSSALRRLAAEYEEIAIEIAGQEGAIRGRSELVSSDYVEISGRVIPFSAIAVVHARIDPFA